MSLEYEPSSERAGDGAGVRALPGARGRIERVRCFGHPCGHAPRTKGRTVLLVPESQGENLAFTVLCVPSSLDSGPRFVSRGGASSVLVASDTAAGMLLAQKVEPSPQAHTHHDSTPNHQPVTLDPTPLTTSPKHRVCGWLRTPPRACSWPARSLALPRFRAKRKQPQTFLGRFP